MAPVPLDDLNRMDPGAFAATLGDVFEHSPWIAEAAYVQRPFATLNALFQAMTQAVRDAGTERQGTLIRSHPDLAGKAAREGAVTADSAREQMSAGLDRLSEEEFAAFHRLNEAYRAKFNMPFVVCVRRHGKESILRLFEQRLRHERRRSGRRRWPKSSASPRCGSTSGYRRRIASKFTGGFRPMCSTPIAAVPGGVQIEFLEVFSSGKSRVLTRATTNADGRTDRPLIADAPIPIAHYELRFAVGDYFARQGTPAADPPFLGIVPVRFAIAEPEAHYHIPLWLRPGATPPTAEADGCRLDDTGNCSRSGRSPRAMIPLARGPSWSILLDWTCRFAADCRPKHPIAPSPKSANRDHRRISFDYLVGGGEQHGGHGDA